MTTYPVCAFCGREIDGKALRGKSIGETMTCQDCAETIVMPALMEKAKKDGTEAAIQKALKK